MKSDIRLLDFHKTEKIKEILSDRDYLILHARYLNGDAHKYTRKRLAQEFSVTQTRITQIEEKAIKRLVKYIEGEL